MMAENLGDPASGGLACSRTFWTALASLLSVTVLITGSYQVLYFCQPISAQFPPHGTCHGPGWALRWLLALVSWNPWNY